MLAIFNVFSLVVGAIIGAVARSWLWVIGPSIVVGAGINMVHDMISYNDPFLHPNAILLDSISFFIFAAITFLLRQWHRKRKQIEDGEATQV